MTETPPLILTWGYREHSELSLRRVLSLAGEGARIVDVRRNASSSPPQWTASGLKQAFGDRYLHLPTLGNHAQAKPGEWRMMNELAALEALATLAEIYENGGGPVILLCAELRNYHCHRRQVAEQLRGRVPGSIVKHLL
jgi:uncharacterized protein (DUF488 family)